MNNSPEVAIYCRESTSKQDINSLITLCTRAAKDLGYQKYTIYKDVKSGYSKERDEYQKLKKDIQEEKINVLILYESSRITRDEIEHHIFYAMLRLFDVKVYTVVNGWLDLNNEDDLFFSAMVNLVDAREGRRTAKRVLDRMKEKAEQGYWITGTPPLGYALINKKLEIVKEEAMIVKEIYKLFLEGKTRQSIAMKLGFEVKKVRRILTNPVYIGKIRFGTKKTVNKKRIESKAPLIFQGLHLPIIDETTYNLVQSKLSKIIREKPADNYIFKNLITCVCGNKMYRVVKEKKIFYQCTGRVISSCSLHLIEETELFNKVMLELENLINNLNLDNIKLADNKNIQSQIILHQKELKKLCTKEETLARQLLSESISEEIYKKFYKEIKKKKEYSQERINLLSQKIISEKEKKKNSELLKIYFNKIKKEKDPEKLNSFLNLIIEDIKFVNDYRFYINLKF